MTITQVENHLSRTCIKQYFSKRGPESPNLRTQACAKWTLCARSVEKKYYFIIVSLKEFVKNILFSNLLYLYSLLRSFYITLYVRIYKMHNIISDF